MAQNRLDCIIFALQTNHKTMKTMTTQATEIFRINDKQWDYSDYRLSVIAVFGFMFANKLKQVGESLTIENGVKVWTIDVAPQSGN